MLVLIFLSTLFWQYNLHAAASSSTDVQPDATASCSTDTKSRGLTQEQLDRMGTLEPGFIRTAEGNIRLVGYYPDDADAVAQLIEHTENWDTRYHPLLESHDVNLLTRCQNSYQQVPTLGISFTSRFAVSAYKQIDRTLCHIKTTLLCRIETTLFDRNGNFKKNVNINSRRVEAGRCLQPLMDLEWTFLTRRTDGSYYEHTRDYALLIKQQSSHAPTDHAYMSPGFDWLATVEGGRQVNLYRCPSLKGTVGNHIEDMSSDWVSAKPHEFKRSEKKEIVRAALNLFTLPDEEYSEPLICSFAFSEGILYRKLALILPRCVKLFHLEANDTKKTIQAKGKIIARANLADDTPSDQLSCFKAAAFSPYMQDERHSNLYIATNNSVVCYCCATDTIKSSSLYTTLQHLSGGQCKIVVSPDGERVAVTNQHAGIAVFDTKTMALLCTLKQNGLCKHIALHHDADYDLLVTSVKHEDGRFEESVWQLKARSDHPSLQQICSDMLGRYVKKGMVARVRLRAS